MGWLITAALLLAVCLLPISIHLIYDVVGAKILLGVGPVRIQAFPPNRDKKASKKNSTRTKNTPQKQNNSDNKGGKLADFLPLFETVLSVISELRRRLVVTDLQLKICMTGEDPCDLSIQYGRTWAALGNLLPLLERLFVLKKRNIDISCDYTSNESYVFANAVLCISLGRLLWIAVFHGRHVLKEFIKIYNNRKGGTDI